MVKADIKEAYRMVPIHPQDQILLGISRENVVYTDSPLPIGLRSAAKLFSPIADPIDHNKEGYSKTTALLR